MVGPRGLTIALAAAGGAVVAVTAADKILRGTKRGFVGEKVAVGDVFLRAKQDSFFPPPLGNVEAIRFEAKREGKGFIGLLTLDLEQGNAWARVPLNIQSETQINGIALVTYCPPDRSDACLFGAYILYTSPDSREVLLDSYSGSFSGRMFSVRCEDHLRTTRGDLQEEFVFRTPNLLEEPSSDVKEEDRRLVVVGKKTGRVEKLQTPRLDCPERTFQSQND